MNPLPPEKRLSVDDAPLREWIAHVPALWAKRLERHGLTAESLDGRGTTLGERMVNISMRFQDLRHGDRRQDGKLLHLLGTCQNPASEAAVWLRALLPTAALPHSKTREIELLAGALEHKLQDPDLSDPERRMRWATLALTGAARLSDREREPGQPAAIERILAIAWQSVPETLLYKGQSMLPQWTRQSSQEPPWELFSRQCFDLLRTRNWHDALPSALLPLKLWLATGKLDDMSLVDQQEAELNHGLVPSSHVGDRAFLNALEQKVPWPQDPRLPLMVDWLLQANPRLAERAIPEILGAALDERTLPVHSSGPSKRL